MVSAHACPARVESACSQRAGAKAASGSRPTSLRMRRYSCLRGRREFALVLRRGRRASTKELVLFALAPRTAPSASPAKVGIVITKKVGTAVERNRLRRRCKAVLDEASLGDGKWFVIQCKPAAAALTFAQLGEQLKSVLRESSRGAGEAQSFRESTRR